jgi:nucleotide-binding universal stress UspA family protein
MTTVSPVTVTFEHILVPTDFSEVSERALEYAKSLAKQGNSELLLVHVNPPIDLITPPEAAWIDVSKLESLREEQLEQTGAGLRSEGYRARVISLTGALHDELLQAVHDNKVDLIALGTHGRKGVDRFLAGSDAEAVFRQAPCPVLSVGPAAPALQGEEWTLREVICATTLKPSSAELVAYAHKLAAQHGAELVLVHVKDGGREQDADWASFEEAFHHFAPEYLGKGTWLRTRLASAAPDVTIVDLARQRGSDLIVMGARPASSMATHLPPGTAAKVLLEAPCPVLTLLQH